MKMNRKSEKINKDTHILEIIAKAREWQKTKSLETSSNVCKMLNLLADEYLDKDCLSEGYLSIQIELKEDKEENE